MNISIFTIENTIKKRKVIVLSGLAILFGGFTMVTDGFESYFRGTGFYFSESLMFSSFWWLFIPFLYLQFILLAGKRGPGFHFLVMVMLMLLHLFAFPALVWLISKLFYYHTFRYGQTVQFAISEHAVKLALIYTIPAGCFLYFKWKKQPAEPAPTPDEPKPVNLLASFLVTEGNRRIHVLPNDILYFSASSPYVTLHQKDRKYLYKASLKSVVEQVDSTRFVRVHKSAIINIAQVDFYTSRLNGDYDVVMRNGTTLRVSRNYAAGFKEKFAQGHQDTPQ